MEQRYLGTVFSLSVVFLVSVVSLTLARIDQTIIDVPNLFVGALFTFAFGIMLLYIKDKYF